MGRTTAGYSWVGTWLAAVERLATDSSAARFIYSARWQCATDAEEVPRAMRMFTARGEADPHAEARKTWKGVLRLAGSIPMIAGISAGRMRLPPFVNAPGSARLWEAGKSFEQVCRQALTAHRSYR